MATTEIDAHFARPAANHDAVPAGSLTEQDKTQGCMIYLGNITKRNYLKSQHFSNGMNT